MFSSNKYICNGTCVSNHLRHLTFEGQPGAALRAWGLGEGLRSCGHDVEFAMSREVAEACKYKGREVHLFEPESLDKLVSKAKPDILLFQHWPLGALKERPRVI